MAVTAFDCPWLIHRNNPLNVVKYNVCSYISTIICHKNYRTANSIHSKTNIHSSILTLFLSYTPPILQFQHSKITNKVWHITCLLSNNVDTRDSIGSKKDKKDKIWIINWSQPLWHTGADTPVDPSRMSVLSVEWRHWNKIRFPQYRKGSGSPMISVSFDFKSLVLRRRRGGYLSYLEMECAMCLLEAWCPAWQMVVGSVICMGVLCLFISIIAWGPQQSCQIFTSSRQVKQSGRCGPPAATPMIICGAQLHGVPISGGLTGPGLLALSYPP